jgi:hypothetical protein
MAVYVARTRDMSNARRILTRKRKRMGHLEVV